MSVVGPIAVAGAVLLLLGALAALAPRALTATLALQAVGTALLGVAGGIALVERETAGSPWRNDVHLAFGIDGLSGFFLLALALTGVPALLFARGYLAGSRHARPVAAATGLFLAVLAGVLTARDLVSFLGLWELMTLVPAAAILIVRRERRVRHTVLVYLGLTHVGGVGVWVALLLLLRYGALGNPSALAAQGTGIQVLVALAAVVGFGTKAGLMPFHSWLPRAHPVAPSHVSALMSGMMIKVALYGLIRVDLQWLPGPKLWLGLVLLLFGGLSALLGVLYAIFQHDLKRLLAFHSIENVGIIVLGLGASVVFASRGVSLWASLAFGAALLHTLNHAVFKALLFLGAGAFEKRVHGLELDRLGGLLRRMPWTGGAFFVGCAAIAGLPPLNGFASEWLTLQSLLHVATSTGGSLWVALAGGLATVALAATAALAVLCFVKVVGLVLLGRPRRRACEDAVEAPLSMRAGMALLAGLCVLLGVLPAVVLPKLTALAPFGSAGLSEHVTVRIPGTGSLPTLWVALALVALTGGLVLARSSRRAAPSPVWTCGQLVVPALAWTSSGFSKTLRLAIETVLRPERSIELRTRGGVVQELSYRASVPHLFDTHLYGPIVRASLVGARVARRLQSGSLAAYVLYLAALVVFLLVLARAGAFS